MAVKTMSTITIAIPPFAGTESGSASTKTTSPTICSTAPLPSCQCPISRSLTMPLMHAHATWARCSSPTTTPSRRRQRAQTMQTRVMLAATFSRFRGATAARLPVPSQRKSQVSSSVLLFCFAFRLGNLPARNFCANQASVSSKSALKPIPPSLASQT